MPKYYRHHIHPFIHVKFVKKESAGKSRSQNNIRKQADILSARMYIYEIYLPTQESGTRILIEPYHRVTHNHASVCLIMIGTNAGGRIGSCYVLQKCFVLHAGQNFTHFDISDLIHFIQLTRFFHVFSNDLCSNVIDNIKHH